MTAMRGADQVLLERFERFAREHRHESLEKLRRAGLVVIHEWKDEHGRDWHRKEFKQHPAVVAWRWLYDTKNMIAQWRNGAAWTPIIRPASHGAR